MTIRSIIRALTVGELAAVLISVSGIGCSLASAQEAGPPATGSSQQQQNVGVPETGSPELQQIVVTGSRIHQTTDTTTPAPVAVISGEVLDTRGFTQAGDALNELTSNTPNSYGIEGGPSLTNGLALAGQDFPNLFNLGPARTLTLVNGLRMVSSSSGLGDEAVDTNVIPTGLLDRIEVVQGGGAAVYGSGAIAGVVNYILKKNFQGIQVDAQYSSADDYPVRTVKAMAGTNFSDGRGNVAAEFDYSNSGFIEAVNRTPHGYIYLTGPNPAPGAGTNGIPSTVYVSNFAAYTTQNGLVLNNPFNPTASGVVQVNGEGAQINSSGNIEPVNLGTPVPGLPIFAYNSGIDWNTSLIGDLVPKVDRSVGNIIGSYDITDDIKLSVSLLDAHITSELPNFLTTYTEFTPSYSAVYPYLAPIPFTKTNPYLSAATIAALGAADPAFAAGSPLYLSKEWTNFDPSGGTLFETTNTYRGVVGLDGAFERWNRDFYWSAYYTHGEVDSSTLSYGVNGPNMQLASQATRNAAGQIVCAVNNPVVTNPSCVPVNIFGEAPLTQQQFDYVSVQTGQALFGTIGPEQNIQDDALATLGGDLVALPGGQSQFSVSFEHRNEQASINPLQADLLGLGYQEIPVLPESGSYHTNEGALELDAPILGGNSKLPLVNALDLNGSYRYVDNSIAGTEGVWGAGLRWDMGEGLTLRLSKSRNFRAPTINQVFSPASNSLGGATSPCSNNQITLGSDPAARAANCLALFTANPTFGLDTLPGGVANTPGNRLANFTANPVATTSITTSGNAALQNEVSNTWTYGFVFQPQYVRGLTLSVDRLRLQLTDGLTLFTPDNFLATCFDAKVQPTAYCDTFTYTSDGNIATAKQTTVNAAIETVRAEIYNFNYVFPLQPIWRRLAGSLDVNAQATHNTYSATTVAGVTTIYNGTETLPTWVAVLNLQYMYRRLGVNYQLNYMPSSLLSETATQANSPDGLSQVSQNMTHNISVAYEFGKHFSLRVGVNDIFNKLPSFPTTTYGDIIGRQYFAGVKASF